MKTRTTKIFFMILLMAAVTLACSLFSGKTQTENTPQSGPSNPAQPAGFSVIRFAEYVTDGGDLQSPSRTFSSDVTTVYAYFEYWGMSNGDSWGYTLTQEGYEYIDATDEVWEDGPEGWVAYYFENLEPGNYEFTLYLDADPVQSESFSIGATTQNPDAGFSTFGTIQFAAGVTEDLIPIRPMSEFAYGVTEVYAVFPYFNMVEGMDWTREWLLDGEVEVSRDLTWEEGSDGMDYSFFAYEGGEALEPGNYTFNLYIEDQLARSASFVIVGEQAVEQTEPQGPANPEDIIDPNLIQAWEILAYANPEILRDVAQFALDHHIRMILTDEIESKGVYRCSTESREPGTLYISEEFWNRASWEEVAATIAHELTHAVQHIEAGNCGCTIENEYYAYVTEFYVLQETGRMDLLESKWRGAYDDSGHFDSGKLWQAVKEAYSECPEY